MYGSCDAFYASASRSTASNDVGTKTAGTYQSNQSVHQSTDKLSARIKHLCKINTIKFCYNSFEIIAPIEIPSWYKPTDFNRPTDQRTYYYCTSHHHSLTSSSFPVQQHSSEQITHGISPKIYFQSQAILYIIPAFHSHPYATLYARNTPHHGFDRAEDQDTAGLLCLWREFNMSHNLTPRSVAKNFQVSDALLKIQKLPEGATPRAGHLADFSKPTIQHPIHKSIHS